MKSIMLLLVIVISLNLTAAVSAQDFLFYRIEDMSQINLADFSAKLKKEVAEHEAVIVLLPRDKNNIYRKTLKAENKNDITDLLVYIMRLKGKEIMVNTQLMDNEINNIILGLKNKYGPSIRYTIISYTKFNLPKAENSGQGKLESGKENKNEDPIKPEEETSPAGALLLAIFLFIGGIFTIWVIKEFIRAFTYKRKKNNSKVLHIYNNSTPRSIINTYEKEKNDFFV